MSDCKEQEQVIECPSHSTEDAAKALICLIELLEPFDKDVRQRILNAAKVFLVDA